MKTKFLSIFIILIAVVVAVVFIVLGRNETSQNKSDTFAVGAPFPDFTVTEVDGITITKDSLKDKPAIIWFITSWCVPCQIGAREVSRLDKELGEKSFEVLVIFVDPNETNADLIKRLKN